MKYFWYGPLAQLVEQLTLNQRVAGSSPSRPIGCQTHVISTSLATSVVSKKMYVMTFFCFQVGFSGIHLSLLAFDSMFYTS